MPAYLQSRKTFRRVTIYREWVAADVANTVGCGEDVLLEPAGISLPAQYGTVRLLDLFDASVLDIFG